MFYISVLQAGDVIFGETESSCFAMLCLWWGNNNCWLIFLKWSADAGHFLLLNQQGFARMNPGRSGLHINNLIITTARLNFTVISITFFTFSN